ncbi:MAG: hypothetical protein U0R50_03885 [Gaiellales bacterium]
MFRRSRSGAVLSEGELYGAINMLMRIDERVAEIHAALDLEEEDDGEDPEEDT